MSSPTAAPTLTTTGQTSASQYGFVDPLGSSSSLQNALYGTNGALNGDALSLYKNNADSVMNTLSGLSGPLQKTLSDTATYQANNALNATGSNFANMGALGSGAAAQAFGQAIANPFAQAQAQLQNSQLTTASSALSSLLGASTNAYGNALQAGSSLMNNTSGLVAPTTITNPEYTAQAGKQQAATQGLTGGLSTALGGLTGEAAGKKAVQTK
jgi:hypothetical protein